MLFCLFSRFSPGAGTAASLEESAGFLSFHELSELMQALPGFLMLLTGEGKLLYLSDSVSEHLGHSMVSTHALKNDCLCSVLKGFSNSTEGLPSMASLCHFPGGSGGTGGQRVRYHRRLRPFNHKDQPVNINVA